MISESSMGEFGPLKSANGCTIGVLPAEATEGDWVLHKLRRDRGSKEELSLNIGLIVRADEDGAKFSIVGQCLFDDLWRCSAATQRKNEFAAFFNAEDLLLLQMDGAIQKGWRKLNAAEVKERLETRICYLDGSSYMEKWGSD